jgi:2-aminomuconate deaminase
MTDETGTVLPDKAAPRGKYPHVRRAGDYLFVSGISSRRPDESFAGAEIDARGTMTVSIELQTRAVLDTISDILKSQGAGLHDLVDLTAFLVDMADYGTYNRVYAEYFPNSGPARTTVAVHQLPNPVLRIEIKATAYKPIA